MCAKVTGPLYSVGASGKVADAMVFFNWKGVNVVRQWLKPSNPKSADQGDVRLILGGTGRGVSAIKKGSVYEEQLLALNIMPSGQTRQSFLVKKIIDVLIPNIGKFETEVTAYEAHTAKADFASAATTLGLADFEVSYAGTTKKYTGGLMLYLLAKMGITLAFTVSPFTTELASWTSTEVTSFVTTLSVPTPPTP